MRFFRKTILITISICGLAVSSWQCKKGTHASKQDPKSIIEKVGEDMLNSYTSSFGKFKVSTCKYAKSGDKLKCEDSPKVNVWEVAQKKTGADVEEMFLGTVAEPERDRGITQLWHVYGNKKEDSWIYLPALGKVKQIITNGQGREENQRYFGSEIAVEDVAIRNVNDYTYKILREEEYNGRQVWVIEASPVGSAGKNGNIVYWIDQERYFVLKQDIYDRKDNLFKQMIFSDIENVDDVWIAKKLSMNNLLTRRVTNIEVLSVAYNVDISDEYLSQKSLKDAAFRDKQLAQLRASAN